MLSDESGADYRRLMRDIVFELKGMRRELMVDLEAEDPVRLGERIAVGKALSMIYAQMRAFDLDPQEIGLDEADTV